MSNITDKNNTIQVVLFILELQSDDLQRSSFGLYVSISGDSEILTKVNLLNNHSTNPKTWGLLTEEPTDEERIEYIESHFVPVTINAVPTLYQAAYYIIARSSMQSIMLVKELHTEVLMRRLKADLGDYDITIHDSDKEDRADDNQRVIRLTLEEKEESWLNA